jgi:hypothetical protein
MRILSLDLRKKTLERTLWTMNYITLGGSRHRCYRADTTLFSALFRHTLSRVHLDFCGTRGNCEALHTCDT